MHKTLRSALSIGTLIRLAAFSVAWLAMTEGIAGSWFIGLPVILLAAMFFAGDDEEQSSSLSLSFKGIAMFIPFFLWQSVISGFDVALRALRPEMDLLPVSMQYTMSLPDGAAQRLFINSITLMPGTVSVMVRENIVLVHVLDEKQPVTAALQLLETRAGAVFKGSRPAGRSV